MCCLSFLPQKYTDHKNNKLAGVELCQILHGNSLAAKN